MTLRLPTIFLSEIAGGNQEFIDQLLPHLKPEFFSDKADFFDRTIFKLLLEHQQRYNTPATLEQAQIALQKLELDQSAYDKAKEQLTAIYEPHPPRHFDWLKDNLVEYVRSRSYEIAQDRAENARDRRKDPRPHLQDALEALDFTIDETLGIGLDPDIVFLSIQQSAVKQPIHSLPRWPSVGRGELAVIQAPPNAGKSTGLIHITCDYLKQGLNVLFFTLEMSDQVTLKRVTANLLQHEINKLDKLNVAEIREGLGDYQALGKLKIRQFEGGMAHAGHFDQYVKELNRKETFVPDVLVIDYLNECASRKLSHGKNMTTYEYVGACMGELRGLAVKYNMIAWTATQTNRAGYDGEPDMKNTADSAQINHKADIIVGFCPVKNQPHSLQTSVIKMRDGEKPRPFLTGVNFSTMTLCEFDDPLLTKKETEEVDQKVQKKPTMFNTRKPTAPAALRKAN